MKELFSPALFPLMKSSAQDSSAGGEALPRSRVGISSVLRTFVAVSISDNPNYDRSGDDKDPWAAGDRRRRTENAIVPFCATS